METDNKVRIRLMEPTIPNFPDYKYVGGMGPIDSSCLHAMAYIYTHAKISSFTFAMYAPITKADVAMDSAIIKVVNGRVINASENFDMCVGDLIDE